MAYVRLKPDPDQEENLLVLVPMDISLPYDDGSCRLVTDIWVRDKEGENGFITIVFDVYKVQQDTTYCEVARLLLGDYLFNRIFNELPPLGSKRSLHVDYSYIARLEDFLNLFGLLSTLMNS